MDIKQAFKVQKLLRRFMPFRLSLWMTIKTYRILREPQPWYYKLRLQWFIKCCAKQGLVKK